MGKKDEDEKADLTLLEDIGHYLHQLNPEADKKLEYGKKETGVHEDVPALPEEPQKAEELPTSEFKSETREATAPDLSPEMPSPDVEVFDDHFAPEPAPPETAEFKIEETTEVKNEEPPAPTEEPVAHVEEPAPEMEAVAPEPNEHKAEEPPVEKHKPLEKFEEVREFGKNISTTTAAIPGNPPFSIVIKSIKFSEDADDILGALKEYGIATSGNENIFKQGLASGSILITQLSESTAILLVHKFRQYDLEIEMGLSEEIRPHKTREQKGLVSKINLNQNKTESVDLKFSTESSKDLPISTTPSLENFVINRYIGIVSEHTFIPESEVETSPWEEKYTFLANQLKSKALKLRGNAIVGVAYQLTPIDPNQFKLTCTGSVVWVSPLVEKTI
jgi:uncharacterized protein YbjQ (UPF0145 family)